MHSPATFDRAILSLHRALAWNGPLITLLALALALTAGLLLIRLTPLDGVFLVVLVVGGVATLIEPLAGLALALFLGPLRAYLSAEVVQVPAQIGQVFVALTLAVWLARGLAHREIRFPLPLGGREGNHEGLPLLRSQPPSRGRLGRDSSRRPAPETGAWSLGNEVAQTTTIPHEGNHVGNHVGNRVGNHAGNHEGLPLLLPLLIFLGAALVSLWDAVELPVYGVPEFIKWVQIVLLFLFVSDHLTPRNLPWLLGALLATGVFQASVGIWQFGLRGAGPEHFGILGGRFYRAYGTFEQPNPYAGYLGLTASLAIGILGNWCIGKLGDWGIGKLGHWDIGTLGIASAALLMLAALGMSWSRGAWMGFGAAVVVMTVALPRQARWGLLLVAVLVVAGLLLHATGLMPASVTARLTDFVQDVQFKDVRGMGISDVNYAVIERLAHWQTALEMTRYNLWTGVGFGCYEPAYSRFALINWPIALGHAHNYYLNVVAETGLTGLAAYLFLWGAVFWQTWRVTRRADGLWRGVAIGLLGTWTHLSVHHFLDNLYVNNVHLHVGVLLGLLAFIIQQTNKPTNQQISKSTNQPMSLS